MALVQCPECENLVSDKAAFCTRCGNPRSNPPQTNRITIGDGVRIGIGLLIVSIVCSLVLGIFVSIFSISILSSLNKSTPSFLLPSGPRTR